VTLDGEKFRGPDPRPSKRVKNPKAMKDMHKRGGVCALNCNVTPVSLHHVLSRSQGGDDTEANLIFLCGRNNGSSRQDRSERHAYACAAGRAFAVGTPRHDRLHQSQVG